jgi:D,D-heptose 1,7-bisphosphate phosphatase
VTFPALFFDRDGTLSQEVGHLVDVEKLVLLERAPEAVRLARAAGFKAVLVTNQSAVARGLVAEGQVREANRRVGEACGGFDGVYYCPHHPSEGVEPYRRACDCRKPGPGMLLRARDELEIDLARSFLIGDSVADLEAARAAGCGSVLVLTGHGREALGSPRAAGLAWDHVAEDVLAAVRWAVEATLEAEPGRRA